MRRQAQGLGIGGLLGLVQAAQALIRIDQEGIQQHRILIFHDVLQRGQHIAIEVGIGHLLAP
ncbi:hypothetical protein D3C84_918930 [compost metagenome]